ncbi:HD domain-containing phosphohydrolase [Desulfoplanes formicivorans]|uniref:Transcriptional regulator n=1 Tax=Desulfoplanes formicivorans TaxID=1592317 RepID=A0A194AEA2_9BACT|nr:HD domain-containing phosphohydrolase [Desulfoplanes formicivorans]GAU08412.1 transcriptional regulator [Desulfoplanes formicivorans]
MKEKILFVDDEPNLLRGIKLVLRKKFTVDIAEGPLNGLKKFKSDGPYAVVISDLKMPGADGIDFLEQVRKISDETVRMLLTGYGDLDSAIEAVNRGQIFRFMNKPCPKETLIANLEAGVAQYRLIRAEKEVLKGTLRGTIRVLSNILSLVNPAAFGRGERIRGQMITLARELGLHGVWQYELAALLSQIGWVSVTSLGPDSHMDDQDMAPEVAVAVEKHPEAAAWLLSDIPRLEKVIDMIRLQKADFQPDQNIPIGAYMLRVCLDFDALKQQEMLTADAVDFMLKNAGLYHPEVLERFCRLVTTSRKQGVRSHKLKDLQEGWIFAEDLAVKGGGHLLIAKGHVVSQATLYRLKILSETYSLGDRYVSVYPPLFSDD